MTAAVPGSGAPRWAELGLRVVSSLVLAPIALGAVWLGAVWFEALVMLLAVAMALEWARMVQGPAWRAAGGGIALAALAAIAAAALGYAAIALAALVAGPVLAAAIEKDARPRRWTWLVGGVAYVAAPSVCLVWLRGSPLAGLPVVLWLLLAVWGTDIVAYAVGRTLGGPKLAPRISPGKTWSGLLGGMAGAGAVSAGFALWQGLGAWPAMLGAGLGLAIAVVAQTGDLFESWVKRRCGAKDSGALIPGHGGVLDRLDGVLAAAPVAALVVWLSGGDMPPWR